LRQPPLLSNPCEIKKNLGFGSGGAAVIHPRRHRTTHLGAEAGSAGTAEVNHGSPCRYQPPRLSTPRCYHSSHPRIAPCCSRVNAHINSYVNSHSYQQPRLSTRTSPARTCPPRTHLASRIYCSCLAATTSRLATRDPQLQNGTKEKNATRYQVWIPTKS
jgi:hypothetical protein